MSRIETVKGPIPPEKLGVTLIHEHLFCDFASGYVKREAESSAWDSSRRQLFNESMKMDLLGQLKRDPHYVADNLRLLDESTALDELREFAKYGGSSVVCQDLIGVGRDPQILRKLSLETGLNIVACTGWYASGAHPSYVRRMTIDQLSDLLVRELIDGIDGTGIKAGAIGECALSRPAPFHPDEEKVLRAACRAQKRTGVAFTFHPPIYDTTSKKLVEQGEMIIDLIEKEGADLSKFWMSHADFTCRNLDYLRRLMERRISIAFDNFGMELYYQISYFLSARTATDPERLEAVSTLCQEGFEKQIMLSQDIHLKMLLRKYGGYGYAHILKHILPLLRVYGVTDAQIRTMLVENPKRILVIK